MPGIAGLPTAARQRETEGEYIVKDGIELYLRLLCHHLIDVAIAPVLSGFE
jgi:hypothetical protein